MPSIFSNIFASLGKALSNIGHSPVAETLEAELPAVVEGLVAPAVQNAFSPLNTRVVTLEGQVAGLLEKLATPRTS